MLDMARDGCDESERSRDNDGDDTDSDGIHVDLRFDEAIVVAQS
jgi:hypothetical protein